MHGPSALSAEAQTLRVALLLSGSRIKEEAVHAFLDARRAAGPSASPLRVAADFGELFALSTMAVPQLAHRPLPEQPIVYLDSSDLRTLSVDLAAQHECLSFAWRRVTAAAFEQGSVFNAVDVVLAIENVAVRASTESVGARGGGSSSWDGGAVADVACALAWFPRSGQLLCGISESVLVPPAAVALFDAAKLVDAVERPPSGDVVLKFADPVPPRTFGEALTRVDPATFRQADDWCGQLQEYGAKTGAALAAPYASRREQIVDALKMALEIEPSCRAHPRSAHALFDNVIELAEIKAGAAAALAAKQACKVYGGFRGVRFLSISPAFAAAYADLRTAALLSLRAAFSFALLASRAKSQEEAPSMHALRSLATQRSLGREFAFTCVAPLASRGLQLLPLVKAHPMLADVPVVVIEKGDAAPPEAMWTREYTGAYRAQAVLGIQRSGATAALLRDAAVLLLDDVVETGGSLEAAAQLCYGLGARVVVALVAYAVPDTHARAVQRLARRNVPLLCFLSRM